MNSIPATIIEAKKEECQTYIKQTKNYVALNAAFLFAPVVIVMILKDKSAASLGNSTLAWFVVVEVLFACSVLSGYIVLASLTRSQDDGSFDVFRKTTRFFSMLQSRLFVAGILGLIALAVHLAGK